MNIIAAKKAEIERLHDSYLSGEIPYTQYLMIRDLKLEVISRVRQNMLCNKVS